MKERKKIAAEAVEWLNEMLPEGIDSHYDDLDNAEIVFRELFPNIDLGKHDDGFTAYLWDRNRWAVSPTDVTEV